MSLNPSFTYNAVLTNIVDADTVDLVVDLGLRISMRMRVRMYGINAPEMNTPGGKAAKTALANRVPLGSPVVVRTFKNPTDKYGRWLASIEYKQVDLGNWLVANGHALSN